MSVNETHADTPHDRAGARYIAAAESCRVVRKLAGQLVIAAEAEYDAAVAEMVMYEKSPGIPLPPEEQREIQARLKMPAIGQE